ncbi:MAG: Transcription antitermination protein nusG [Candidatus Wolfebacteria bacterium GW2011_GWA2_47_9b]|uniref:Transcription antitermination protein nusG n=1 Tax=Candidatus Wolfebacteria bacterium GW2011_GWA2_47_9b TaxID=1619005 RepID=A0A0G1X7T7_9BACT|nr:MAG: Transcription antitermination protein nusG [Candidatus Wolfebacteria bacterium GW2011_GWA2_47_9b]
MTETTPQQEHAKPSEKKSEKKELSQKGERHWYAVHTYSGYEDAVARYLKQRVDSLEMDNKIFNVVDGIYILFEFGNDG